MHYTQELEYLTKLSASLIVGNVGVYLLILFFTIIIVFYSDLFVLSTRRFKEIMHNAIKMSLLENIFCRQTVFSTKVTLLLFRILKKSLDFFGTDLTS